jgi:uncharacterized membrane protein
MQQPEMGEAAGTLWRYLRAHGPVTLSALQRGTRLAPPTFYMAVGWLAREGKVRLERAGRATRIALTEQ